MVTGGTNVLIRFIGDTSHLMAGISQAESGLQGFASRMQSFGASLTSLGTKLTLYTTVPILGLGVAATKASVDFDKSMRFINTIAHKTGDEYAQMVEEVKQLSVEVPQSATTLAMAVYNIMSAGFDKFEDAMVLAEVSAKMAVSGMTEADIAAKALTATMNSYGYSLDKAEYVADVLFKGVERGVYSFEELSGTLGNVIALAAQSGISLEELTAACESITKAGLDVKKTTLGLNYVFLSLIKRTEQQNKAVEILSRVSGVDLVSSFSAAGLQSKGLAGVLEDVMEAMEKAGVSVLKLKDMTEEEYQTMAQASVGTGDMMESITQLFPSMLALRSVFSMVRGGMGKFREDMAATANAGGAMGKAFDAAMESTAMQMDMFKSRLTRMMIEFGDKFLPLLNEGMDVLGGFFDKVAALDDATKGLIIRWAAIGAVAGPVLILVGQATSALGTLLGVVGNAATGIWGLASGFAGAMGSAGGLLAFLKTIGTRLVGLAGPIGIILFLLMAIMGKAQDMEGGVGGFIAKLQTILEGIMSKVTDILMRVVTALTPLMDMCAALLDAILEPLMVLVEEVASVLMEVLSAVLPPLLEALRPIFDLLMVLIDAVVPVLVSLLQPLGQMLVKISQGVLAPLLTVIGKILGVLGALLGDILGSLSDWLVKLIDPLMELIDAILTPILALLGAVFDILGPVVEVLGGVLRIALEALEKPLDLIITLVSALVKGLTWLVEKIMGPVTDAFNWVGEKVGGLFQKIGDFLPFSPAKKGPLSKPVHWTYITEGLAPALAQAERDIEDFNAADLEQIPLDEGLPGKFGELNKLMGTAEDRVQSLVGGFKGLGETVSGPVMRSLEKADVIVMGVAGKFTAALATIPAEIRKGIESTLANAVELIKVTVDWSAFAQGLDDVLAVVEERIVVVARTIKESLRDAFDMEPLIESLLEATTVGPSNVRVPVAVSGEAQTQGTVAIGPLGHLAVVALDNEAYAFLEKQLQSHRVFEQKRRGGS